jgi:hypothetical protein
MKEHAKRRSFPESFNTNIIDADECYCSAVQKGADYFESLHQQIIHKTYVQTLIKDIRSWEHSHIHHYSLLTRCFGRNKKPDSPGCFRQG